MSTFGGPPRGVAHGRRRRAALGGLTLAALVLHAGLLGGLDWRGGGAPAASPAQPALTVRVLAPPVPALAAQAKAPADPPAAMPGRVERAAGRMKPAPVPAAPAPAIPVSLVAAAVPVDPAPASAFPAADPTDTEAATAPLVEANPPAVEPPAPPAAAVNTATAANAAERELPVYRTLIPPPVTLRYQLRRGLLQGVGELQWLPRGEGYEARLEGRLAGIAVLTQVSRGGFDEAGVAPSRFTDQRAAGAVRAANFQREAGKISFSGPKVEHPLWVGSQDRLSWMIQLAAVVAAEPQRLQEGGKVVIHVVGARGDSRLWVFRFAGLESIAAGAGTVQTAHFVRDAAEAYDTQVEVWLDPLRHHLPARAVLRSGPGDEGLELLAQDAVAAPP